MLRASFAHLPRPLRNSFGGLPRVAWILGGIVLLHAYGRMVVPFLAVYLLTVLHLAEAGIGLVVGAYGFGMVTGSILGGRILARVPAVWALTGSLAFLGLGFMGLSGASGTVGFAAGIFICASLEGASRPAVVLLFMQPVEPIDRPRCHAVYYTANGLGYGLGGAAGGLLSQIDFSLLFWASGSTNLLAALAVSVLLRHARCVRAMPPAPYESGEGSRTVGRCRSFGVLCAATLLHYLVSHQRMAGYPLYLTGHYGLSTAELGAVFMTNGLVIAATGIVVAYGVRRFEQRGVAAVGAMLLGGGFALLPISSDIAVAFLLCVLMSFGDVLFAPTSTALAYERAATQAKGARLGIHFATIASARSFGPIIGLWGFAVVGPAVTWLLCGLLGATSALMLCCLLERPPRLRWRQRVMAKGRQACARYKRRITS